MKKLILLPIFLFLFSLTFDTALSQQGWFNLNTSGINFCKKIYFLNENTGFLISDYGVRKSQDGGLTWTTQILPGPHRIQNIYFEDEFTGYMVAGHDSFPVNWESSRIYRTSNTGNNWEIVSDGMGSIFSDIVKSSNSYYLVGGYVELGMAAAGAFFKSNGYPFSWSIKKFGSAQTEETHYKTISTISEESGIIAGIYWNDWGGVQSRLYKFINGGDSLYRVFSKPQFTGTSNANAKVQMLNNMTGYVLFDSLYKTTDSGESWFKLEVNAEQLHDVSFINSQTGWVTSNAGIFRTDNGGDTWALQYSMSNYYRSISMVDENYGWIYFFPTGILKTITGGLVSISSSETELPEKFSLHQNFPNPFNPSTTISFDIPQTALVKLTVYDALGKVVATLVNENLPAGSYNYQFSPTMSGQASDNFQLPSGVYFYRLNAGEFSETKRFVILK